jgi:hypothetical protein
LAPYVGIRSIELVTEISVVNWENFCLFYSLRYY